MAYFLHFGTLINIGFLRRINRKIQDYKFNVIEWLSNSFFDLIRKYLEQ